MIWLNRTHYSLLKIYKQKFSKIVPFSQNSSKLRRFRAVHPHSPRITRNLHILLTYSTYVSGTCPGREPCRIPANYANSAQFAHTVHESREIRTICSHYTLCFRCLTSGRERREIPANHMKFAQFAPISRELREFRTLRTKINTYVIDFQMSDHRQRTQENWNESTRFRSIRPPITRITRIPRNSQ